MHKETVINIILDFPHLFCVKKILNEAACLNFYFLLIFEIFQLAMMICHVGSGVIK